MDARRRRPFAKVTPSSLWIDRAVWVLVGATLWGPVSGVFGSIALAIMAFAFFATDQVAVVHSGTGVFASTMAFAAAQFIAFASGLAVCGWLPAVWAPRLVAWPGPRLDSSWFIGTGALSCAVLLAAVRVSRSVVLILPWSNHATAAVAFSSVLVQFVQLVVRVGLTMVLMRRRRALHID